VQSAPNSKGLKAEISQAAHPAAELQVSASYQPIHNQHAAFRNAASNVKQSSRAIVPAGTTNMASIKQLFFAAGPPLLRKAARPI
jgi:hypothetical protein